MSIRKIKSKKFKTEKEAVAWAKEEKSKITSRSVKWETNRLPNDPNYSWEAVLYSDVR